MKDLKHISKFLSLVLRHKPEEIGLVLDENGWADVDSLLEKCTLHGVPLDFETLETLVAENDKQRFAFNGDLSKIRASQGHSVSVDLQLAPVQPPAVLYHGTVYKYLDSIRSVGLQKQQRRHVHLSMDQATAIKVGSRRGKPIILEIDAAGMYSRGHAFYLSQNGVWLCDAVPVTYIKF